DSQPLPDRHRCGGSAPRSRCGVPRTGPLPCWSRGAHRRWVRVAMRSVSGVGIPRWLLVPAGVGAALVLLPLLAMALSVDWGNFIALVTSESSRAALWLSLRTAAASTLVCLIVGVPMAMV